MPLAARVLLLAGLAFPTLACADPCAGESPFTDVPAAASYCTNTEWLRNRGITLGCTATTFCPDEPVTRASMALFLNRLGAIITPTIFDTTFINTSDVDLDASPAERVCTLLDNIEDFPRKIIVHATFSGLASGPLDYQASLLRSTDGGMTYSTIANSLVINGTSGARWSNVTLVGEVNADVGELRVAIRVERANGAIASTDDFTQYRCDTRLIKFSRNGTASPFDLAPPLKAP